MPIELFEKCVRERVADHITTYRSAEARLLQFDRWILASLLQKAIRRDEPEWALPAAASLLRIDPVGLWRRLLVIAFEDVSFADVALVAENPRGKIEEMESIHRKRVGLRRLFRGTTLQGTEMPRTEQPDRNSEVRSRR